MCIEEAEALGVPMAVGSEVRELLAAVERMFGPGADCTDIARVVESRAGCEISGNRGRKS
jgi:hypothetical protein